MDHPTRRKIKIGPTAGDTFETLLFVLTQEVSFARFHLQIARALAHISSEQRLLHCAPVFFGLTFRAHVESAYARAARLFDPTSGTATISSVGSAADKVAGKFRFATPEEVRRKIKSWESQIVSLESFLGRLQELRNGLIAHLDKDVILDPQEMAQTVALSFDDIEHILDVARQVLTDALDSYLFCSYADQILRADDYEALFRILESSRASEPKAP